LPEKVRVPDRCYMCAAEATTREHVPPRSFFPLGYRDGLVTVPSCPKHNNDSSADVEYVRNVIVCAYPVNEVGLSLAPKTLRSFNRSPGLFAHTFEEWWPVLTPQGGSGAFRLKMARFERVMEAIAHGLYYREEGKQYEGKWGIFSPTLSSLKDLQGGGIDDWEAFRRMLALVRFSPRPTAQPKVFSYHVWRETDSKLVYKYQFYEGFVVNALTLPPDFKMRTAGGTRDSQITQSMNV